MTRSVCGGRQWETRAGGQGESHGVGHRPGAIGLPEGVDLVMPGDTAVVSVVLLNPVALEVGQRFAIREDGKTVGAGVVSRVHK